VVGGRRRPRRPARSRGHSRGKKEKATTDQGVGSGPAALIFAAAAPATLVAGVAIERTGEEFFAEISTGLTSTRPGDYQLAVSDIFGGNAFLPVLFRRGGRHRRPLSGRHVSG
jgi:cation:H+ antiporter